MKNDKKNVQAGDYLGEKARSLSAATGRIVFLVTEKKHIKDCQAN